MSPRKTRRGTKRENISEIYIDNSLKSTSKTLRSTRRANKSQNVKGSEEESDNLVEVNSSLDNAINFINVTASKTRKRAGKVQELSINQESSLSANIEESKTKSRTRKKNLKTPKSMKKLKSIKSEVIEANSLISEDESSNVKSHKDERQTNYINNLISEDEEIPNRVPRKKLKLDSHNSSLLKKEYRTPEKSQKASTKQIRISEKEITPKSSPLNVSLTPHRSTKTPKKSPMNLGSPKTHSHGSFNFLNVPRKLSIPDSPSSSEKSNHSLQQPNSFNFSNGSFENTSKSSKSSKSSIKSSSSKEKSISSELKVRPKFSKSPKIVFRTPKSKSTKSKKTSLSNKTLSVSPSKSKKSSNTGTSFKSEKTPRVGSSVKSKKRKQVNSPLKSENVSQLLVESKESKIEKSSKSITSKSRAGPKNHSSLKSKKSTKTVSSVKSTISPKDSPLKYVDSFVISKKSKKSSFKTISPIILPSLNTKKSPKITPIISKKMPKIILSPKKSSKSVSPTKSKKSSKVASASKAGRMSVKLSAKTPINNNTLFKHTCMSPRVIIRKLSSPQLNNSALSAKENQPTVNLVPVDHIPLSVKSEHTRTSINDYKSPKSLKKKRSVTKSESSAKSDKIETHTLKQSVAVNSSSNKNTPTDVLEKNLLNLKPTNTSTPRERVKRTLNSITNKKNKSKRSNISILLNGSSTPKSKAIKRLNNQSNVKRYQPLLEDESEPSLNDSSLIHMSDVFDSDNSQMNNTFEINKSNLDKRKSLQDLNVSQKNNKINNTFEIKKNNSTVAKVKSVKDDTYELENSKIGLQMKLNKRTLNEHELGISEEPESKKNCRVHFANSSLENQIQSNINRVGTPGHVIHQKKMPVLTNNKTPSGQSFINKMENRKRVSSVSKLQVKTPVNTSMYKRRSNSLSDTVLKSRKSNHESQIASVNRLSRPKPIISSEKKLGIKTPVSRQIPNFAEIHQKNFAKMESLVDLKKRVEKRHATLSTGTSSTKKIPAPKYHSGNSKIVPSESTHGVYNKFGFKVRKNDAVNMISNKQVGNVELREKKREDARNILRGVRMNRRFELQMKSRIKSS